jgi:hypothetical protein
MSIYISGTPPGGGLQSDVERRGVLIDRLRAADPP